MCSIIGYYGKNLAAPILVKGLEKMEYRGYDSVGVATKSENKIMLKKGVGKVIQVNESAHLDDLPGISGIGHTRWATHGKPNQTNAHPHHDSKNKFSLIHNGIIENHYSIKEYLLAKGVEFSSDTDSEVLVQFIGYLYKKNKTSFIETIKTALKEVVGAYGIVVISKDEPDKIIAAGFFLRISLNLIFEGTISE